MSAPETHRPESPEPIADEANPFLTDLAVQGLVAASTQNQARSALLFLDPQVLGVKRAARVESRDFTILDASSATGSVF